MSAGQITISLNVSGQVGASPIGPFSADYTLSGQTGGLGPQQVSVPAGAGAGSVVASLAALQTQNLLLILTDEEVTYQINGDGIDRTIKASGMAIHSGSPVITELVFGGNGSADACVTVIQMGVAGTPSTFLGGALYSQEINPVASGNPVITLNFTPPPAAPPLKPVRAFVFVDGVLAVFTDYTIVGDQFTWTGSAFAGTEVVTILA